MSRMDDPANTIVITALSALTPVGDTAERSSAAIAAGMKHIEEHAYHECELQDPEWDEPLPLYVSAVPVLDIFLDGADRLLELAKPALAEVMDKANFKRGDLEQCGLMLALPQADTVISALNLPTQFVPALHTHTGLSTFKLWKTSQAGHTGVFTLLQSAMQKLQAGDLACCIVGGVESYLLKERLTLLDAAWRIRTARNIDGFIPGEAAAMFMIETAEHAKARGAPIIAVIKTIGEGTEREPFHSKRHSTGEGLTQAIEQVMHDTATFPGFATVYGSLNAESYYTFEWGLILARLHAAFAHTAPLSHPAECIGDIGAATGALLLACAVNDFKYSKEPNALSLLWTSGDSDHRMALTLQSAKEHNT